MCGLYGWVFDPSATLDSLPLANAILAQNMCNRGEHSWGMMTPERTVRGLGSLMHSKMVRKLPHEATVAVHTRFATHGGKTLENAHPFRCDSVTGMHNGVIANHISLNRLYDRDFEVDSQHIFQNLSEGRCLEPLEGYGAVVYQRDDTPGEFFMGTFNGGELEIARISYHGQPVGIMWASTYEAVANACFVANLKPSYVDIKEGVVYRVNATNVWDTDFTLEVGKASFSSASRGGVGQGYSSDDWGDEMDYHSFKRGSSRSWVSRNGTWLRADEADELDADEKLAAAFDRLKESEGEESENGDEVTLPIIQDDTAAWTDWAPVYGDEPCHACGEIPGKLCNCTDCYCTPCLSLDPTYQEWFKQAQEEERATKNRRYDPCGECGWTGRLHDKDCSIQPPTELFQPRDDQLALPAACSMPGCALSFGHGGACVYDGELITV